MTHRSDSSGVRRIFILLLLFAVAFTAAGCPFFGGQQQQRPQAPEEISVTGLDYAFDPDTLTVTAGQEVRLTMENRGREVHNWVIRERNVDTGNVPAGQKDGVVFTIDEPGTYTFVCTIPGHEEAGMVGELVVEPE